MEIGNWSATRHLNNIYREIRDLGLEPRLAELEAFGFTVIEDALTPDITAKLRQAILDCAEKRAGRSFDPANETTLREVYLTTHLLAETPVFEEVVMNRRPLALIDYLLGFSCRLSSVTSHIKGPGEVGLLLHSDTGIGVPAPFSPYSHVANCNYAITDYTEDGGCLAIVPGSHRLHRQPTLPEVWLSGDQRNRHAIPIEVRAGSAIIWHGNTWHGSFPRRLPGLRLNLSVYYCRQYMAQREIYDGELLADIKRRHGPKSRLCQLLAPTHGPGAQDEKIDYKAKRYRLPAGRTWQS